MVRTDIDDLILDRVVNAPIRERDDSITIRIIPVDAYFLISSSFQITPTC